ncbi:MAG: hypothetical protein ABJ327_24620 [Litoreibacter sp.]
MTYPEWHIVYAYEGYAETLKEAPPHGFPYLQSITGFWSSLCALTKQAGTVGGSDLNTKSTIYTIGVSFTLEMTLKAAYEETIGRISTLNGNSPQDHLEAAMAAHYAEFLQQVPWYEYDFNGWNRRLQALPTPSFRAYERRVALGIEWGAKALYAQVIAKAAAAAGADKLTMTVAIKNLNTDAFPDVTTLETKEDVRIVEVPRYRAFTHLAQQIAKQGGTFLEIAGNDDILVSVNYDGEVSGGQLLGEFPRPGFDTPRQLLSVTVENLATLLRNLATQDITPEHIYDY